MKITFLGHVVPTKGITELVSACSKINGIKLTLIGLVEDKYKEDLNKIAIGSENAGWLTFTGEIQRHKALKLINHSDIFVLPSYREAFPFTILEAMALSKPIISTDVGAIPEILNIGGSEQCGFCIKPKDVEDLRLIIIKVLNDDILRNKMGNFSRNRVENLYSIENVFPKLLNIWSNLIG